MRSNRCWDRSVSTIIIAIWIYTLAGLFGAVVELLDIHFNGVDHAHFTFFTEHENIKVIKSVGVIDGLKV